MASEKELEKAKLLMDENQEYIDLFIKFQKEFVKILGKYMMLRKDVSLATSEGGEDETRR